MYGYDEYSNITPEQVLQKISQEKIFEWLLGLPFDIDKKYIAPYREDTKPGCWLEKREDGTILFMDWGDREGRRHKSCFGVVMAMYKVSLQSAVDIICKQFGLSTSTIDYKLVDKASYQITGSIPTIITPEHRPFEKRDIRYWNQYIISIQDLIEDNVHAVQRFFLSSKKGRRWITPYNICYDIDFVDAHEIYQPYNEQYKWITNCDENYIGNFDNLPPTGDKIYIEKSYKDHRTFRNLYPELNIIWFINEGCTPSEHILANISFRFKEIILFYDNDKAGIEAAIKLMNVFNKIRPNSCRMVYLQVEPKNISDLAKKEGRKDAIKILDKIL